MINDPKLWEFTCKTCGAHELTVTRIWHILAGPESESWQEWGPLQADHFWHFEFEEEISKDVTQEEESRADYRLAFREYAKDYSISSLQKEEVHQQTDNPGNDIFYVNCAGCGREIEFGWALPNRGGGIFPAECSDFIPQNVWPEPRYVDSWCQKNWLEI